MTDILGNINENRQVFNDFVANNKIYPSMYIQSSSGSYGDIILNSKNCQFCFFVDETEDLKYCYDCVQINNSMDCYESAFHSSWQYESHASNNTSHGICTNICYESDHLFYCDNCHNCSDCFGCVGLCYKQYCIFNKQYAKKDYEIYVAKVIGQMIETGQWGEFFNSSLSFFGYNETVAQEYFPLTKEEAGVKGYKWSDHNADPIIPPGAAIIDRRKNSNTLGLTDEELLATIYLCEITGRPYRIIAQELAFYHKHHLPIPRHHPDQRHADRMALRAPRELHLRTCDKCDQEMISVYEQSNDNKVYCEKCYQKEIYS